MAIDSGKQERKISPIDLTGTNKVLIMDKIPVDKRPPSPLKYAH